MVDNNRVQQDPTALIGPACIAGRRSNGVEAQRLGLDKGLDAGVGGGQGCQVAGRSCSPTSTRGLEDSTDVNECSIFDSRLLERMVNRMTAGRMRIEDTPRVPHLQEVKEFSKPERCINA